MSPEFVWFMAALVAAGLFAGFIGGLFGVGGGIVLVPALYLIFSALNVDEHVRMHVAVATSISTIISTSWRSLSTHAKSGAVDFNVLKTWGPWIALGAVIGSALASAASTQSLVIYFGVGLLIAAAQLGFGNPNWRLVADLPRGAARALIATILGACSAAMGIGGGTFGVPMMTLMGRPIHQAVATASGFGAAIALPATLGFVITGWGHPGLPLGSLGFVNTPGFVLLGLLTAITAPLGARLAHRLDQRLLRRAFAVFLALTAFNLLRNALR
ncbi:MAG TPA: sulfite exporter TauE/SafE family protein [Caulobacterales bacterium]|nr:sulfite exporter TauE/SafE family protein [Caulobacterales bacterium]